MFSRLVICLDIVVLMAEIVQTWGSLIRSIVFADI